MDTDFGASCYRRFLSGDESGFDEILRLYHDSLIFFINRIVNNYETAEDLAADTFMELLIHKNRYRFKSSFKETAEKLFEKLLENRLKSCLKS